MANVKNPSQKEPLANIEDLPWSIDHSTDLTLSQTLIYDVYHVHTIGKWHKLSFQFYGGNLLCSRVSVVSM